MSFLRNILGLGGVAREIGGAIQDTTEVFHVNETEEMRKGAENFQASLAQYRSEFLNAPRSLFSEGIDGLNRLPRPIMALGLIFLFGFALYDPERFSVRMQGLQEVPDQLWWLMGAIVSFYFGARELHYLRNFKGQTRDWNGQRNPKSAPKRKNAQSSATKPATMTAPAISSVDQTSASFSWPSSSDNPAILDWLKMQK